MLVSAETRDLFADIIIPALTMIGIFVTTWFAWADHRRKAAARSPEVSTRATNYTRFPGVLLVETTFRNPHLHGFVIDSLTAPRGWLLAPRTAADPPPQNPYDLPTPASEETTRAAAARTLRLPHEIPAADESLHHGALLQGRSSLVFLLLPARKAEVSRSVMTSSCRISLRCRMTSRSTSAETRTITIKVTPPQN